MDVMTAALAERIRERLGEFAAATAARPPCEVYGQYAGCFSVLLEEALDVIEGRRLVATGTGWPV